MIFVVDSSVALKWFVAEPRHEVAKRMILSGDKLVAPEFAYAEVTNVLWRKARGKALSVPQVSQAIAELPEYVKFMSCDHVHMALAFELAQILEHSIYDCVFLAMTLRLEGALFVTDDENFASKAAAKGYGDKIRTLNDDPLKLAFNDGELLGIRRRYETSRSTIDFVASQVGIPFGDTGIRVYATSDLKPALESPAYFALKKEIGGLSSHQAAVMIALSWLGRGYDGNDFERLYDHAAHLASEPARHAPYIISLIGYLERGIAAYRDTADSKE